MHYPKVLERVDSPEQIYIFHRSFSLGAPDRGFTVHEEVWFHQVELNIPAFTKGKNQLDPLDVEKTRKIANVRIHVKRVIGILRQKYTILQGTLPTDFLTCNKENQVPLIDRIVSVCSALVNLCPPIVPFD